MQNAEIMVDFPLELLRSFASRRILVSTASRQSCRLTVGRPVPEGNLQGKGPGTSQAVSVLTTWTEDWGEDEWRPAPSAATHA